MKVVRRRDSHSPFSENSDNDCEDERGADCRKADGVCLCEKGPYCKQHPQTESSLKCSECGKNKAIVARYSEGYGTEEECVQSDPQGESDADADIEDTDSRLQVVGSLQRISSRKRKRQRIARQDTTESEDDGGRSHRTHRWSLRLSPHRTHNRTILEESISQVRPLVICRCNALETPAASDNKPQRGRWLLKAWPFSLSFPLFFLLILLPVSISIIIVFFSFLLPLTNT
ncbi:uncharacterized protein si:ch211-63p21.1 [Pygocentrus nattereri]|uniref:uncharacterized protein si:ch211-63p21.1 n=1 Tax=Pygocentrus nattereri TaxID=42514 RepID=UPI000814563C|nr:uncharacterized protein si:ch211-63p21.1 [Pygocentrus nattereri]XP_017570753.1 uncharacterized protein si:ch211-63p21.1 [Pygocentrus nattereri]